MLSFFAILMKIMSGKYLFLDTQILKNMRYSVLSNQFINALQQKISKRSQLVSFISETLEIERESASRRLNKSVNFSIEEMGMLALKLGISLDGLLYSNGEHFHFPSFVMHSPMELESIHSLELKVESDLESLSRVILSDPAEYGAIFTYPPLEFLLNYSLLLKFTYFKWGYYYTRSSDFDNYEEWEIPQKLLKLNERLTSIISKLEKAFYIWDNCVIWSFVNDIIYFASIGSLNKNDVKKIKAELHNMLYDFEEMLKTNSVLQGPKEIDIYIADVNLGAGFSYLKSKNNWCSSFYTYFVGAAFNDDYTTTIQLRNWMNSMKKVCTLISGSGVRERKNFFNQQHRIVDFIHTNL